MNDDQTMDLDEIKVRLEKRLTELQALNESGADDRKPVTLDQSKVGRLSRMDAMQGQNMAAETARRRTQEIARIKAALSRIIRDEYGYCLKCEEDIPIKRLDADPAATLCIECVRR
ncbi:MAG: TraR/DksA family transcriptional regulator [Proteobacteria bacterium]|nr:TraR/DksA family transcriptional regulator [Pseudomonadota bacterium]